MQQDNFPTGCTWLQGASLDRAQLQGASLEGAKLQGASLDRAQLQGAFLLGTELEGAILDGAQLQGAALEGAKLQGASLDRAQLQGAFLLGTELEGAMLSEAQLQGAMLEEAELQGAILDGADLRGAVLEGAKLQGSSLAGAQLQGASLKGARVWRAGGIPSFDLTEFESIDTEMKPWENRAAGVTSFIEWRDVIVNSIPAGPLRDRVIMRLALLGADKSNDDLLREFFWKEAHASQPQGEERQKKRAAMLGKLACSSDSAPYVARSLVRNFQMTQSSHVGTQLFTDQLSKGRSDPTACLGVKGFTDEDWLKLSEYNELTHPDMARP